MKLRTLRPLFKDVLLSFVFKKEHLYNGVMLGMSVSVFLNLIATYFHYISLEMVKVMANHKEDPVGDAYSRYLGYTLASVFFKLSYSIISSYYSEKCCRSLMVRFFEDIMKMEYRKIIKTDNAEIFASIQSKMNVYRSVSSILLFKIPSIIVFMVYSLAKISKTRINLVNIVAIYPPLYLIISLFKTGSISNMNSAFLNEKKQSSSFLFDKIRNFKLIKSLGIENEQSEEYYLKISDQRRNLLKMKIECEKSKLFSDVFSNMPFLIILGLLKLQLPGTTLNIGVSFIAFRNLNHLLRQISSLFRSISLSLSGIDLNSDNKDSGDEKEACDFKDSIVFDSVSTKHDQDVIIREISMKIKKNEKIAIVGKNGTGKSSLIRSFMKFADYDGKILIDGRDINSIRNEQLFNLIAYIPQDDSLTNATILENIRTGNKNLKMEDIIEKAKIIGIHEDIVKLKDGYETIVGRNGTNISAGQRNKISLLRAFIKESPIMILDEATSCLDKHYEGFLVKNIMNKLQNKTIIMIIHQKDLIKDFDKVLYLNDGKVDGFDKYKNLMKENKNFRAFIKEGK